MTYYISVFSPETYHAFNQSEQNIAGYKNGLLSKVSKVKIGDKLICYITRISRWIGILEVTGVPFTDTTPIFTLDNDPYTYRLKVKKIVWLEPEYAIPIKEDICWNHLSLSLGHEKGSKKWTVPFRKGLNQLDNSDGIYLEEILTKQANSLETYPLSPDDIKRIEPKLITVDNRQIFVSIPDDEVFDDTVQSQTSQRESIQIQALLAEIGERLGFKIWLPRNDRQRVLECWQPRDSSSLLREIPISFDNMTKNIIENIDVLWIQQRYIARAFEVEHTTAIYSGILRIADLMVLQPNIMINAHIVAPDDRRDKVMKQIARPAFAYVQNKSLPDICTYLSYDSIKEIHELDRLDRMKDDIIDDFAEYTEYADD